jgi:hypothetical protein
VWVAADTSRWRATDRWQKEVRQRVGGYEGEGMEGKKLKRERMREKI